MGLFGETQTEAQTKVIKAIERDPVKGFVTIAVLAARPPRPGVIVPVKGRTILLPDWTGKEWHWYGDLAQLYSHFPDLSRRGVEDTDRQRSKLAKLNVDFMDDMGNNKPTPAQAFSYYVACVRLVIATRAGSDSATGPFFVSTLEEAIKNVPATIGEAIASAFVAGAEVVLPSAKAAAGILAGLFGDALKSGIGIALLIGAGLYIWSRHKGSSQED